MMSTVQAFATRNRLMDELPARQYGRMLSACELVTLSPRQVVCDQDGVFTHVYFPLTASISLMIKVAEHPPLGMVLVGSEGMLGASLALGVSAAPLRAVVQGGGTALRISVPGFIALLEENPAIGVVLNRYLYVLMEQLSQTAACNRFHEVEARLVRWLLLTHDRAHADNFQLTHLFLAEILGVQRSAVTIAAGMLQHKGLISYSRGVITIIDRVGLERLSCECYGLLLADYQRQIA
ncbi:MAG: Crp/Fnr family transcriptional regulator [Gammaproteobacteria bacterium]|nr:Crp/Fnr family transcriptional regulator [Gammaproteobacteria bacterium]